MSEPAPEPEPAIPSDGAWGEHPGGRRTPLYAGAGRGVWITRGLALLLLVAVGVGIGAYARYGGKPQVEGPPAQGPVPVKVVTIRAEEVALEPRFLGQTGPSRVVELRPRVAGYLTGRTFAEGSNVTKGQKLFQVDARPFELQLSEIKARITAAEARRDQAQLQLKRYEALRAKQAATQGEVEEWQKEERVAAADLELQRAQAASAQLQIDYASLEAPMAGVIGEALRDVGTYVDASSRLAVIQQIDPIYVRYALTEQNLLRLERLRAAQELSQADRSQLELRLTLADGRVHPHLGRLDFEDLQLSADTGTATFRGVIPNPEHSLRPGQFVHVNVLGMRRLNVIRVPHAAVRHAPSGATVFVVGAQGTVELRPIELGEWLGEGLWVVRSGLAPGDRVIVNRILVLRPGVPVTPEEVGAASIAAEASASEGQK